MAIWNIQNIFMRACAVRPTWIFHMYNNLPSIDGPPIGEFLCVFFNANTSHIVKSTAKIL